MHSFLTFVLLAVGLGMASVNLSLPLVTEAAYYSAQGASTGMNGFMILGLSALGFVLVLKTK